MVSEQTAFLLEEQKKAKDFSIHLYTNFLSLVENALDQTQDAEDRQNLQLVYSTIQNQIKTFTEEIAEDISFLESQLKGIDQIRDLHDPAKEKELEDLLLADGHELLPMDQFKQDLVREAEASKKSLEAMLGDFKNMVESGNTKTLVLLLEALDEESENTDGESEAFSNLEVSDSCCSDDTKLSQDSCCGGENVDILSALSELQNQNGEDMEKQGCCSKEKKSCCPDGKGACCSSEKQGCCSQEKGECCSSEKESCSTEGKGECSSEQKDENSRYAPEKEKSSCCGQCRSDKSSCPCGDACTCTASCGSDSSGSDSSGSD